MKKFLSLCLMLTFSICAFGQQDTLKLRVMTYNLRFGQLATLEQLAEHIKAFKPDFVALEEVDCKTQRKAAAHQNGKDFLGQLAAMTEMFGLYGKAINYSNGYYGIGILSKYPYVSTKKILLPNITNDEQRVVLEALCELPGDTVVFASTHFDYKSDESRSAQADFINNHFANSKYPVIIGGDLNAVPQDNVIRNKMKKNWFNATCDDLTFPAWNPKEKLDYIFAKPMKGWKLVRSQAVMSRLSDHLPVVSDIILIRNK